MPSKKLDIAMGQLQKIRYNCRQATFLIEKKQIERLTFREQIELRIHLAGCSVCKLYSKQSLLINNIVQQLFYTSMKHELHLDDSFKKNLQERIDAELNKS